MGENNGRKILVLGVGNKLLKDEGVGVHVVERLLKDYRFSENVEVVDGGTLGMRLLDPISKAGCLIVVDAVQNGGTPGTVYRLDGDDLRKSIAFKNSMHQLDLLETIAYAELLGEAPKAVIIGIEPRDASPWGMELTGPVQANVDELIRRVAEEIAIAGGMMERISH